MMIKDPPGLPYHNFKDRQVFRMQFVRHDHTLNLYKPGDPIHSWYTHALSPFESECGPVFRNQALIDTGAKELFGYSECELGMPFHGAHFDGQPDPLCQNSYLALGISRNVNEISGHPNAFVVQADCHVRAAGCNHKMDLDNGRRVTSWKPVALLAGWRKGESSLGTVVATSPGGTRVAAATWSRILVWSFNPKLLHQGELRHYFPIRDYNQRKEFGRLRPTLLTPAGVVHNMIWTDETHLYATTDQGLVNWDIGPKSDGERHELTLAYDAWPDTAVAIPALPHKLQNRQWGFT